jgi:hypothetical protein
LLLRMRSSSWRNGMTTLTEKTETLAVEVACSTDALSVTLTDGRVVSVPLVWFPRLADVSPRQRSGWELIGGGIGIHWEAIDEDISVASLLRPETLASRHWLGLLGFRLDGRRSRAGFTRSYPGPL